LWIISEDLRGGSGTRLTEGGVDVRRRGTSVEHAGAVTDGRRLDWIASASLLLAGPHSQNEGGFAAGGNDRVWRPGWTVDEVPRHEGTFEAFDDQQAVASQHQEVLLAGFVVVERHRLARLQPIQPNAQIIEMSFSLTSESAHDTHVVM
jgi:hypothetical protein